MMGRQHESQLRSVSTTLNPTPRTINHKPYHQRVRNAEWSQGTSFRHASLLYLPLWHERRVGTAWLPILANLGYMSFSHFPCVTQVWGRRGCKQSRLWLCNIRAFSLVKKPNCGDNVAANVFRFCERWCAAIMSQLGKLHAHHLRFLDIPTPGLEAHASHA